MDTMLVNNGKREDLFTYLYINRYICRAYTQRLRHTRTADCGGFEWMQMSRSLVVTPATDDGNL